MKTAIIVQARMTSTRLPGKVLKEVLGKPLLEYQIERLRRVRRADEIIIATTTNPADQPIVDLCRHLGITCTRGSEEDVLARYYEAAKLRQADVVVRITSDCPVIDPDLIDRIIGHFLEHSGTVDYVSNMLQLSYPYGMAVEVFSFRVLEEAYNEASLRHEREHVTPFIYVHPERYRLANIQHDVDLSRHRWTVDTAEDFSLIEKILTALYPAKPDFGTGDILDLLNKHPDWPLINAHVSQKKLGE